MSESLAITYSKHGKPQEVAGLEKQNVSAVGPTQVRIDVKLAMINPSDVNTLEGTYATLPELPAVGGREAVGLVAEVGSAVKTLRVGQQVQPPPAMGVWRQSVVAEEADVIPFPEGLSIEQAAMLSVNPPTAWLMLSEFRRGPVRDRDRESARAQDDQSRPSRGTLRRIESTRSGARAAR